MARISGYSAILAGAFLVVLGVAYAMIIGANLRPVREAAWVIVPALFLVALVAWTARVTGYWP
ncbi:MAG: hypothetical protein EPO26_08865 [Chloroflexota bacterium]|nr:MAG: hypothetical protein EPO26_08865 [Chloroflexota bacterium]